MGNRVKCTVGACPFPGIVLRIWAKHAESEGHCILVQPGLEGLQGSVMSQHFSKVPASHNFSPLPQTYQRRQ